MKKLIAPAQLLKETLQPETDGLKYRAGLLPTELELAKWQY
jgi:hypothetical protein